MAEKETQLAKVAPAALVKSDVPEYLQGKAGQSGMEEIGQDDIIIPRLSIAQALSPAMKKTNAAFIKGLEVGQLFNSLTGEIYGTAVNVVPLFFFKQFIKFKSIKEGGGVIKMYARREDVPPAELEFGEEGPLTTEFKCWMSLLLQKGKKPEAIVVSFKSTGLKTCRKWNSLIRRVSMDAGREVPAYAKTYQLESVTETKGEQEWEGFKVTPGAFVPQDFFEAANTYFTQLKGAGVVIDTTGLDNEGQGGDSKEGDTSF